MKNNLLVVLSILLINETFAQKNVINPRLAEYWSSSWISCPQIPQRDYGIYHFRKSFTLEKPFEKFIVHVSGDNRYRLFVNGSAVCSGPARGDLYNWYYESVDIAPYLKSGKNTIAALVWNMGVYAPVAQISNQTAFVVQGDGDAENVVNTDQTWKAYHDTAYQPCSLDNPQRLHTYMVIGPGDDVNGNKYPWGWEQNDFNDSLWKPAVKIASPVAFGSGSDNLWTLVPRNIPLFNEKQQRILNVRRSDNIDIKVEFLKGDQPLVIEANTKVSILLDQSFNTLAYPEIILTKGKDAVVTITYAEALLDSNGIKGNRNEITGKKILGNYDIFQADGGTHRLYRPLWMRTFRYMQLDITTGAEPLQIDDLYGMIIGYPFEQKAAFGSSDPSLQDIWDVGWRTARLCAGETYFDCPYYEQLQYEGDTRIQSLISLYVTGDDRLMRKALLNFYDSRVPEGLTQGRFPSNRIQVIPPFSLYWVTMVYDYWMHRKDDEFVSGFLTGINGVLDWYEKHIDHKKNMLGPMNWWNFTDWNNAFPGGTPPGADKGNSSIVTLQYANTLLQAAPLYEYFGKHNEAMRFRQLAKSLLQGTYSNCFDSKKGEMADNPLKNSFSQHASIMGVLTGCVPQQDQKSVMRKVLYDTSLSQATFYYRFYLTRALKKAGMADLYYSQLKPWRDMLKIGLTTFAENPDPTRSDCHAWSSSPNYDFLATICGIVPGSQGFSTVRIEPALGELKQANCNMPHPYGNISVSLNRKGNDGIKADIILPEKLSGLFVWKGKEIKLHSGRQTIII